MTERGQLYNENPSNGFSVKNEQIIPKSPKWSEITSKVIENCLKSKNHNNFR